MDTSRVRRADERAYQAELWPQGPEVTNMSEKQACQAAI